VFGLAVVIVAVQVHPDGRGAGLRQRTAVLAPPVVLLAAVFVAVGVGAGDDPDVALFQAAAHLGVAGGAFGHLPGQVQGRLHRGPLPGVVGPGDHHAGLGEGVPVTNPGGQVQSPDLPAFGGLPQADALGHLREAGGQALQFLGDLLVAVVGRLLDGLLLAQVDLEVRDHLADVHVGLVQVGDVSPLDQVVPDFAVLQDLVLVGVDPRSLLVAQGVDPQHLLAFLDLEKGAAGHVGTHGATSNRGGIS
jgi:hypothetical protein